MARDKDHRPAAQPGDASERSRLDPFVVATGDAPPRDQRDLMERPFFSLAKAKRVAPILYESGGVRVEVFAGADCGLATIWDADVLIWAASQIVAAENNGLRTSRFFRFTPYQLLMAVSRGTGAREYRLLKNALIRLQSTSIRTTIRQGEHWRRHQFSWINEWEELTTRDGRVEGMEFVLPDWFYRGVIDRSLVLAIDPAYFRLTGGIERWLYRVARKHAGHQPPRLAVRGRAPSPEIRQHGADFRFRARPAPHRRSAIATRLPPRHSPRRAARTAANPAAQSIHSAC